MCRSVGDHRYLWLILYSANAYGQDQVGHNRLYRIDTWLVGFCLHVFLYSSLFYLTRLSWEGGIYLLFDNTFWIGIMSLSSSNNSYGSESSKDSVKVVVLEKDKHNKKQWSTEVKTGLSAGGLEPLAVPGWSKPLTLLEAKGVDCEKQVETRIRMLNILAGMAEEAFWGDSPKEFR